MGIFHIAAGITSPSADPEQKPQPCMRWPSGGDEAMAVVVTAGGET